MYGQRNYGNSGQSSYEKDRNQSGQYGGHDRQDHPREGERNSYNTGANQYQSGQQRGQYGNDHDNRENFGSNQEKGAYGSGGAGQYGQGGIGGHGGLANSQGRDRSENQYGNSAGNHRDQYAGEGYGNRQDHDPRSGEYRQHSNDQEITNER